MPLPAIASVPSEPLHDPPSGEQPQALPQRLLRWGEAHRLWLFIGVLALYLLGFNGQWRIERDSALYLTIGQNLAAGQGYTFEGKSEGLAFPGLPLLFAGSFKLFGAHAIQADLVLMLAMGFAALGLVYRLFLLHAGRPTAVWMVVGVAGTRLFYRYCFELLTDLPFLLGVMAFLAGYEAIFYRRKSACGAVAAQPRPIALAFDWALLVCGFGLALVMRPAIWALLVAIILTLVCLAIRALAQPGSARSHMFLGLAAVVAVAIFLSVDLRRHSGSLPEYEGTLIHELFSNPGHTAKEIFTQNIPELCNSALVKAFFGCPILPGFNALCSLFVIVLSVSLLWRRLLWGMWALVTIAMLLLFKPLDRYMLPVLPLLVFAWWRFLLWVHRATPAKWADLAFLGLIVFGVSTNFARLGEMVVEQRRHNFLAHYHEGRYASLYDVAKLVSTRTPPDAWILVGPKAGRVIVFLSHRNTIKPINETPRDPASTMEYALIGPKWDNAGPTGMTPDESVLKWVQAHHYRLGPRIGRIVKLPGEKIGWELHRVLAGPPD